MSGDVVAELVAELRAKARWEVRPLWHVSHSGPSGRHVNNEKPCDLGAQR